MGRAIDMERDINVLKASIEKLENTVRGMVSKLDSLDDKSSKTVKVDLIEDVGANTDDIKGGKNEKEKFEKYIHEKTKELIKDRTGDSVSDKWWYKILKWV